MVSMQKADDNPLIEKRIIFTGQKYIPLTTGTKVKFHFQTRRCDTGEILDDSRDPQMLGQPMELVLGKKFKLEVWEAIVQQMALNEVAKFKVDKKLVSQYPFVSKALRDMNKRQKSQGSGVDHKEQQQHHHCCGMMLQNQGLGYKDLDSLLAKSSDLEFTLELLSVQLPEQYDKESWQMADDEKLQKVGDLRNEGNASYKKQEYAKAEECYRMAVGLLEQLMLKEKPHDEDWLALAKQKVPVLLNYAQCRLLDKDYYAVIEHCNEILELEPSNVKALYRRAKAHAGAWNPEEAIYDFQQAAELDPSLQSNVQKELKVIDGLKRQRDLQDRKCLQKLF